MNSYPIFLHLENFNCLVVGGGNVAMRKVKGLLEAGSRPCIIAPEICADLQAIVEKNQLVWQQRKFEQGDCAPFQLVIAATNNSEVNKLVSDEALKAKLLVNNVSDPEHSNFYVPATIRRSPLEFAIGTSGEVPYLSRKLKQLFETKLAHEISDNIDEMKNCRASIIERANGDELVKRQLLETELEPLVEQFLKEFLK